MEPFLEPVQIVSAQNVSQQHTQNSIPDAAETDYNIEDLITETLYCKVEDANDVEGVVSAELIVDISQECPKNIAKKLSKFFGSTRRTATDFQKQSFLVKAC